MNANKSIYFLCSPSMGILDNWLPVLVQIKHKKPELDLYIIIPKASTTELIDTENILTVTAERIFSGVIYRQYDESWGLAGSLSLAKEKIRSDVASRFLCKVIDRFKGVKFLFIDWFSVWVIRVIGFVVNRRSQFNIHNIKADSALLLYDVVEEVKAYNSVLNQVFDGAKRFSLSHGLDINCSEINDRSSDVRIDKDLMVYLFSQSEESHYVKSFGIPKENMRVVGVPRHDDSWVDYICSASDLSDLCEGEKKCVTLFSRSLSSYHPLDRKRKALKIIKKTLMDERGFKVLVKLHPKERGESVYFDIFGEDNYGTTWELTNSHPFALGKISEFCVVFFSGVSVDMCCLGIPTVEYLDMRGLPEHDNETALRVNGDPVFSYRYLGFVEGASSIREFINTVEEFLDNREQKVEMFRERYQRYFPKEKNLSESIAAEIINSALG